MPASGLPEPPDWRPDVHLLSGLSLPAVALDATGRLLHCNPAAAARLGRSSSECVGADSLGLVFPSASAGTVAEILGRVVAGDSWAGELPVLGADGVERSLHTSWSPVYTDAAPSGALVLMESSTGAGWRVSPLNARLQRLAAVTTELLNAPDVDTVIDVVINHMADAAGATTSSLSLLVDEDNLVLVGLRGARPGAASRWARFPVSDPTPAGDAVRAGHALVIPNSDEFRARYPGLEMATEGERAMLCLPLQVAGRSIGVVTLSFPGPRTFDTAELEFSRVLADTCAQSLDRIQALAAVADRETKLRFLADASAELARSLDYEATLKTVANLAVPWFADWCVIQVLQDGVLRPLAVAHPDDLLESRVKELQDRYPPDADVSRGAYQVLRTGVSELVPDVTDEMLVAAARDEDHLQVLRDLHFRSAMQVPLKVRDQVLGVIAWVAGEGGRRFSAEDLAFGEDLARRAAVAIDNSHLHSQVRDVAVRLQRAVLPSRVPEIPGWDIAVRYLPAGRTEVGGDFYDVVPLNDGRIVAFVGDVMGRGVGAASAMAQMRSALRTLTAVDPDPAFVMASLDQLFEEYDLQRLVTVAYAVADPARERIHVVNAGHPPPVHLHRDGTASDISTDGTLVFGAGGGDRTVLTRPFTVGDTLLMFSDGLVERRDESLDQGQRRVRDNVRLLLGADLTKGLGDLVARVRDDSRDDDVAAVALRLREDGFSAGT